MRYVYVYYCEYWSIHHLQFGLPKVFDSTDAVLHYFRERHPKAKHLRVKIQKVDGWVSVYNHNTPLLKHDQRIYRVPLLTVGISTLPMVWSKGVCVCDR